MHAHHSNLLGHIQRFALTVRTQVDATLLKIFLQSSADNDSLLTVAVRLCQRRLQAV